MLAVVACNGPADPGRFGEAQLSLVPEFHTRAARSIELHAVTVRLSRMNGGDDAVIEVTEEIEAGRDSQEVTVTVALLESPEEFLLELFVIDTQERLLFASRDTVIALAISTGESSVPLAVGIQYVGPGAEAATTQILAPTAPVRPGGAARLTATATDAEGRPIPGALFEWEVVEGPGRVESVATGDVSIAEIRADAAGEITVRAYIPTLEPEHEATTNLSVVPNEGPTATILLPEDGSAFDEGGLVTFLGAATDSDDGDLTGDALRWESDVQGPLGNGISFERSDLLAGTHTITLAATDNEGATSVVDVTITIAPDPVILLALESVAFSAVTGGDPAPQTLTVTNRGGASSVLDDLAVGTITYGGGASEWLAATLDRVAAPAVLTLQPSTGGLETGTYTASVPVVSEKASNSPQTVMVTLDVTAAPSVRWSHSFDYAPEDLGTYTVSAQLSAPGAQDVTVPFTVSGSATLGEDYFLGAESPLVIPAGETAVDLSVMLVDDALPEPTESVFLQMGVPVNAVTGAPTSLSLQVTDNDALLSDVFSVVESCEAVIAPDIEDATVSVIARSEQGGGLADATVELFANGSSMGFGQPRLTTDASGYAATTYSSPVTGLHAIEARMSAGETSVSVYDSMYVSGPGTVSELVIVSGDNQDIPVGEGGDPFVVQALDAAGSPVSGINVAWRFANCFATSTDAGGQTSAILVAPYRTIPGGPFSIVASIPGVPPVTFTYYYVGATAAGAAGGDEVPMRGGSGR